MREKILVAFKEYCKGQEFNMRTKGDRRAAIRDLLTDVMHIAYSYNINIDNVMIDTAIEVFEIEKEEKQ